jgi:hypothetical protein
MATKKAPSKKKKAAPTIKPKIIRLKGLKPVAGRIFSCPGDCGTLTVSTGVTPSKLVVIF